MNKRLLIVLFFLTTRSLVAENCSLDLDPEIEDLLDSNITKLEAPVPVKNTCFATANILSLLTPQCTPEDNPPVIDAVAVLKEDLYRETTGPVTRRSLLDQPALQPDFFANNNSWMLSTELFYNYSPAVYFTKDSPFIDSYIALNNQNIVNEIAKAELTDIDIPGVLGLFSTIKLQQHRVGVMCGYARHWDKWSITMRMPLYYLLEHFYLTDEEIDRIKNNPFFRNDDAATAVTSEDEVKQFALKHIVSDRFGIGDARLALLGHIYDTPCADVWFGLQATIPTAATLAKGLLGGEFDPKAIIPPFNLQHFFDTFSCNDNQDLADRVIREELTDFLVSGLDRLSTILINTPLGNGSHFGLGPEIYCRYRFNDYFSMHTYASIEAYTPHSENRFFLVDKCAEDLDRCWRDPAKTGENLALLNSLIVTTLFPIGVRTVVHPGVRFQINHAFMYKTEHWDCKLGFDYWLQGRESFNTISMTVPFDKPLNMKKGTRSFAQQGKIFGNFGYYNCINDCVNWHISANFDAPLFFKGIGKNYTLSLRLGLEF